MADSPITCKRRFPVLEFEETINTMHRNWKTALLGDSTHSVADMIVDASTSSEGLSEKHMLVARSYHAALLNKTKFHAPLFH